MDSSLQLGNENLSEEVKRRVPGPLTQFQRNFIQTVTLLRKLPTRVLHCKKPRAAVAFLRLDREAMKSLTEEDTDDFLLSKVRTNAGLFHTALLSLHPLPRNCDPERISLPLMICEMLRHQTPTPQVYLGTVCNSFLSVWLWCPDAW